MREAWIKAIRLLMILGCVLIIEETAAGRPVTRFSTIMLASALMCQCIADLRPRKPKGPTMSDVRSVHSHVGCPLCDYDDCPNGDIQGAVGNLLLHYIDDHWTFVEQLHDTASDHNSRVQFLASTLGLHALHEHE